MEDRTHVFDEDPDLSQFVEHGLTEAELFLAKHAAFESYYEATRQRDDTSSSEQPPAL